MGVCGVGKSTVARGLAEMCGGRFIEGDAFHSPENIQAMSSGVPLSDQQRWNWLANLAAAVSELNANDSAPVFIACSALKRSYRDLLRGKIGSLALLHLHGEPELIRQRLAARRDHFMPPSLLESQLSDLEPPDARQEAPVHYIDVAGSLGEVTREAAVLFCRRHVASVGAPNRGEQALPTGNVQGQWESQWPKQGGTAK